MLIQTFLQNYKTLIHLILAIVLGVITSACMPGKNDRQTSDLQFKTVNNNLAMHYVYSGDVGKQGVMFIHGTPGSWSAFVDYLNDKELQQHFFMLSVDRLNWGDSDRQKSFSFDSQVDAIHQVMQSYPDKKWIVVGHSLSASLAPKIALKYSNSVKALLLLAGTFSPQLGKPRWYNHVADNLLINWLIPNKLKDANVEIMALENELHLLNKELLNTKLDCEVVIVQGMKDKLVSPLNSQFIANHWDANINQLSVIELDHEGHFLPWRQTNLITEQIKQLGKN